MNKGQLIDEIRNLNPTAGKTFLGQFEEPSLKEYLEHLQAAQSHVVRIHGWVRKPRERQRLAS
jgi:hypothetical protein